MEAVIPTEHEMTLRYADSMKLFERNGVIAFGKWRDWNRASTKEEADMLLRNFRDEAAASSANFKYGVKNDSQDFTS